MHPDSPYYQFDPSSIGWLHRRHAAGEVIRKDDIIRLLEANPDNADDPLLQDYLAPALKGELNGKPGRPAITAVKLYRYQAAWSFYEERLAQFQRERDDGTRVREPYEEEPSMQVAQEVADEFALGCTGRSFLNRISLMKNAQQCRE